MPTGAADAATPDRSYCRLLKWKVFAPGYHNAEIYTPPQVATVPANFAALRGLVVPVGKLGHDRQQRLLKKLGFPNCGQITRCDATPDGGYEVDLDRIPVDVGEVVNAGWLNSGSVELKQNYRDPRDPAKKLPGDVLTAIALLGEEQPALPGMELPRATFPDGTEVPAATRMPDWLGAMADVTREMSAAVEPPEADCKTVCFSAMFQERPVTPDEIIAALATLSPDDKAKVAAAAGAAPVVPPPADAVLSDDPTKKKPEPDGDEPPKWFRAFADDVTKRVGALEADKTTTMAAAAEEKEKAFSAQVDREVKARGIDLRVTPHVLKTSVKPTALALLNSKEFSSEADRTKEFSAYLDGFGALPVNPALRDTANDSKGKGAASPLLQQMLRPGGIVAREYPQTARELRTGQAATA